MPSHTKSERKKNRSKLIGPGAKSDRERQIADRKKRGSTLIGPGAKSDRERAARASKSAAKRIRKLKKETQVKFPPLKRKRKSK